MFFSTYNTASIYVCLETIFKGLIEDLMDNET